MTFERNSQKIVIAGASSLLGAELKSLLEESKFAGWDLRLVDEETAAGMLTEAGGEPAVIRPVEEDSFDHAWFVFFAGSAEFTKVNVAAARRTGARVFDLSGGLAGQPDSVAWFPKLDGMLGREFPRAPGTYSVPAASATAVAGLALALGKIAVKKLSVTTFVPVSEAGRI